MELFNDKGDLIVQEVLNSKGEPVTLTKREASLAKFNQERCNALGFEIPITTMTAISKRIIEQKFFTIQPSLYMPVAVGAEGAWATEIATYREFSVGGDFSKGILNTASSNARLTNSDTGVDLIKTPTRLWAEQAVWTLPELEMASRAGNWQIVEAKERARKKKWDLGIQEVAFLGIKGDATVLGLLNQANVNANTALITGPISAMDVATFTTLIQSLVQAYRANCNYTAWPTRFIIPESDYNGLAVPYNTNFPNISRLEYLEKMFKAITMQSDFKILPLAYATAANNNGYTGLNKNVYTLMNYDADSGLMNIPVPYSATAQNTVNGFQYQNVGYGQFTGYKQFRELEMLYFTY